MFAKVIRLKELTKKLHEESISPDELAELELIRTEGPDYEAVYNDLVNPEYIQKEVQATYKFLKNRKSVLTTIMSSQAKPTKVIQLGWRRILSAAAAIIVIAVSAYLWSYFTRPVKEDTTAGRFPINATVDKLPGKNNAILTLSNGDIIELDKIKPGLIAQQGASSVRKTEDGKLVYETGKKSATIKINTLTTPAGTQYPIVLEDGTKIFLNSVSKLDFPEKFASDKRVVTFSGEGYFEIAHDISRPFFVVIDGQVIRVTGTKFSVNAYPDERYKITTLLEGGIKISPAPADRYAHSVSLTTNPKSIAVKPNQAAIYDTISKGIKISPDPDVESAVAFVNGQFMITNAAVPVLMRQLARWYNVQIVYEKGYNPSDIIISGVFDKNQKLSEIIKILKELGVKARLEGNKLIVGPL